MRRTIPSLKKGSAGFGWYKKYLEHGPESFKQSISPHAFNWGAGNIQRPTAFFDLSTDEESFGRIVFELAQDVVPKTVHNFKSLCKGDGYKNLSYKDSKLHRVLKGVVIMGGDAERKDGTGNHSAGVNRYFKDENFIITHTGRGLISMVSNGVHTNGSQFYISLGQTEHLNVRSVVFGRVIKGLEVLDAIEKVYTHKQAPSRDIIIRDCGILSEGQFADAAELNAPVTCASPSSPVIPFIVNSDYAQNSVGQQNIFTMPRRKGYTIV